MASAPYEIPAVPGRPGWAEVSCSVWRAALREAFGKLGDKLDLRQVASVGLGTLFPAVVALDEDGEPLTPAIPYSDLRSQAQVQWLDERGLRAHMEDEHGGVILPGTTSVTTILWLRDRQPEVFAQTALFGHANTYLAGWLTGRLVIDTGSASLTGLFDPERGAWDQELLDATGLSASLFPPALDGCALAGEVTARAAEETGLKAGTPVAVGSGDSLAACLGTAVVESGDILDVGGTTDSVCLCVSRFQPLSGTFLTCHAVPARWVCIAATSYTGGSLPWLARNLGATEEQLFAEAAQAQPAASGLVFLPYLKGERSPILDPEARGAFVGLSDATTRADLARAVMEGAALALRHNLEAMEQAHGCRIAGITIVGGPSKVALWNQIKADVCQRRVRILEYEERTALGAALMGAIAGGYVPEYDSWVRAKDYAGLRAKLGAMCQVRNEFEPVSERGPLYDDLFAKYVALYPALKGAGVF